MSSTTVGTIEYDVRLSLAQLKKDTAAAEKLVADSNKKINNATKQANKTTSQKSTSSVGGASVTEAEMRVTNLKRQAKESADAISSYTPQIQRNFLAVERANNQVYNASTRTSDAITKYGANSVQATRATNALNVAVQSQSTAQSRLDSSLQNTNKGLQLSKSGMVALGAATATVAAVIATNLGGAINRSDTLNNFPKVMSNLKINTEDSSESIKLLSNELRGLPTPLDSAAMAVQRLTAVNKDVKGSTALFLGLNNAVLAGGASADIQATAIEQISQSYAKGKPDMVEWRALLTAMPAQLSQVAEAMGFVSADALGESLREGKTSIDDFLLTIARLNTEGVNGYQSFEEQARNATGGIQTSITNLQTAVQRSIASVIDTIGQDNIKEGAEAIGDGFENAAGAVNFLIRTLQPLNPIFAVAGSGAVATAATVGLLTGSIYVATKALAGFRLMLTLISKHPIIAVLSILAGVITAVTVAAGGIGESMEGAEDSSDALKDSLAGYQAPLRAATDDAATLGKQLAKLDEQMAKANEDYRYQLAQLVADKNKNIAQLTSVLDSEKQEYDQAYAERLASFTKTQDQEQLTHAQTQKKLQNQIDFLTKYNNAANNTQLSELQFALARENAEYQKSTALRQGEFDLQTQSAATEYEKRRAENQKKLDEELALLAKHREEVMGVRGVILLDEIESLRKSRDEQLKSLAQQRADAYSSSSAGGTAAGQAFSDNFKGFLDKVTADSGNAGTNSAKSFTDRFGDAMRMAVQEPAKFWSPMVKSFENVLGLMQGKLEIKNGQIVMKAGGGGGGGGWAEGGYTGAGGKNEVAGLVHRGEYVIPQSQVNQSTGMPDMSKFGGGGDKIEVTLNMQGIMASSPSDKRAIAMEMGQLINQSLTAKGKKPLWN